MIAGIVLKDTVEEDSQLALLSEGELVCEPASTNEEIVDLLKEKGPDIVAVDAGDTQGSAELTEDEKELKEEGYAFTPSSHNKAASRRLKALKAMAFEKMGDDTPEFIRFSPHITSEELAIHGDEALESYGINPENISSAEQFDAVLGAVTARFYQQNQFREMGVVVPEA